MQEMYFVLTVSICIFATYKDARDELALLAIVYICIYVIRLSPTRSEIILRTLSVYFHHHSG